MKFIANTLNGADHREGGAHDAMNVVSEQLRLLAHITEPVRNAGGQPHTDSSTQDEYFQALSIKVDIYEGMLSGRVALPPCMNQDQLKQGAILLARLLQFDLTCRAAWTPKARSLSGSLCESVFKLAMVRLSAFVSRARSLRVNQRLLLMESTCAPSHSLLCWTRTTIF